ncbi:hypothetical protein ZWY2020_055722 [Hordeum vulgare]|nr:hypothetical protein ZWY2020_055722 [Hordeum vulgare]
MVAPSRSRTNSVRQNLGDWLSHFFNYLWTANDVPNWHSSSQLWYNVSLQNKGTVSCRVASIKEMEWSASLLQFVTSYHSSRISEII